MSRTSALGTKLTALAMSTLLATSTPLTATVAYAEENSDDADATVEQDAQQAPKDEIVYTRTDANGAASGTYVVNYFNTPQAVEVADPGTYDKVTNLSTTEQLEDADGTVNLTTLAGQPFYYQGDLADGTQLPWKIDITYTLDGKEVSPDELSGADGDLDIELKITGLDDDSATADFAKSFVLQAQGTFADANFNLTDAGDATISTVGDKTLVTYLQLPGTDGDYHIKGKATDFNYSGWQIAAMPLSLDLNVADYDTSQLTDAAGELESATTQLADGGSSLRSGLSQLNTGAATAATGAAALTDGTGALYNGATQLSAGAQSAASGAQQFAAGLATAKAGADQLDNGLNSTETRAKVAQLTQGVTALHKALTATSGNVLQPSFYDAANSNATYATSLCNSITELYTTGKLNDTGNTLANKALQLAAAQQAIAAQKAAAAAAAQGVSDNADALSATAASVDMSTITTAGTDAGNAKAAVDSAANDIAGVATSATDAMSNADAATGSLSSASSNIESAKQQIEAQRAVLGDATTDAILASLNSASSQINNASASAAQASSNAGAAANAAQSAQASTSAASNSVAQLQSSLNNIDMDKAAQLSTGVQALNANLNTLKAASNDIVTAADDANNAADGAATQAYDANTLFDTMKTYGQALVGVATASQTYASTIKAQLSDKGDVATSLGQIDGGMQQLSGSLATAGQGASDLADGLDQLNTGATALSNGAPALVAGANQLSAGAGQLQSGAGQLSSGLSTLSAGTQTAYTGSGTLSDGLNQLRDAVSGMDRKVLDEVQETIDEKLGTGYQLHSFVDAGNTDVNEVQFVYVVDGVEDPGDSDDAAAETAADADDDSSQTFTQRLVALFKHDDE